MEQSGFIVSIDLGTSNMIGLVGRRNEKGVISILASESIPADSCVKHGIVYNIDEAAGKVKKLISLLENKIGKKIGKVYVPISGMSLKSSPHTESKSLFSDGGLVTFTMIDEMEQMARSRVIPLMANYGVVAPEVYLDGQFESDPIDKEASAIDVKYQLISGRPNIKSNLQRCISDKNQIGIAGFVVGAVATGAILLDEEEKNAGCALIDFGGGTTTLSIYKGGLMCYLSVIPFGGRTITKDVQSLGFNEEMAETYKIKYGRVGRIKQKSDNKEIKDSSIDVKELNKVVQLRQEEILMNVLEQIKQSGYAEDLGAGVIVTGGASQLTGLPEFITEKSKLPVKSAVVKRLYINNAIDLLQKPSYSQALGLMLFATENCEKVEVPRYTERPRPMYEQHQPAPSQPVQDEPQNSKPLVKEPEEEEDEPEVIDTRNDKGGKKGKKQKTVFSFFGKIQNIGGAIFDDEK